VPSGGRDSLKQRASTSPSVPVPTSASSSGTWASTVNAQGRYTKRRAGAAPSPHPPLHIGSFWSRQNWRVHDRHGLCESAGRKRGMIVELEKQIPDSQSCSFGEISVAPCSGSHLQYDIAGSENMDAETSVDCRVSVK